MRPPLSSAAVVGLGYIGLSTAVSLATGGLEVTGVITNDGTVFELAAAAQTSSRGSRPMVYSSRARTTAESSTIITRIFFISFAGSYHLADRVQQLRLIEGTLHHVGVRSQQKAAFPILGSSELTIITGIPLSPLSAFSASSNPNPSRRGI